MTFLAHFIVVHMTVGDTIDISYLYTMGENMTPPNLIEVIWPPGWGSCEAGQRRGKIKNDR